MLQNSRCKQIYGSAFDSNSQICGGEANANAGACQGDSGGPMVQQGPNGLWYLQGLVSWGYGCGGGTVFTRVSYFFDWIRLKISNSN
jgi:secreted trypsin-like serine protease